MWILLLLTPFLSVLAQSECESLIDLPGLEGSASISDFEPGTHYLRRPQVELAPCRSHTASLDEMRAYLAPVTRRRVITRTVAGVRLTDTPEMIELFQQIHERDSRYTREPWKYTKGAAFYTPRDCRTVNCAMTHLYGERLGVQLLYLRSKYGFNGSSLGVGEGVPWNSDSLDIALTMLEDIAPLLPADGRRFVFSNETKYVATSWVNVYAPWKNLPQDEKTTSLSHELGHVLSEPMVYGPEWLALGGWTSSLNAKGDKVWHMGRPETAVLEYAKTSPDEDFGETFFMYRYNGAALKRNFPDKYNYMRDNVFKGLEYTSPANCR